MLKLIATCDKCGADIPTNRTRLEATCGPLPSPFRSVDPVTGQMRFDVCAPCLRGLLDVLAPPSAPIPAPAPPPGVTFKVGATNGMPMEPLTVRTEIPPRHRTS